MLGFIFASSPCRLWKLNSGPQCSHRPSLQLTQVPNAHTPVTLPTKHCLSPQPRLFILKRTQLKSTILVNSHTPCTCHRVPWWRPQPRSPLASPSPPCSYHPSHSPLIFLTTACVYVVPFKSQFHKQIDVNYFLAASSVRHDVYEPHPCSVQS